MFKKRGYEEHVDLLCVSFPGEEEMISPPYQTPHAAFLPFCAGPSQKCQSDAIRQDVTFTVCL